jgi:hypothetical protein
MMTAMDPRLRYRGIGLPILVIVAVLLAAGCGRESAERPTGYTYSTDEVVGAFDAADVQLARVGRELKNKDNGYFGPSDGDPRWRVSITSDSDADRSWERGRERSAERRNRDKTTIAGHSESFTR